ncbi:MAG: N-acetyltransferase [Deltaproteobacteria bacterium]|nr:N-acetyltransferase [Deltaproteobacteria bacterium]
MRLSVEVVPSLSAVDPNEWNALSADNPFVEHEFLRLLEDSGSVGEGSGWLPTPLLVRDGKTLVGAAPAYLKTDSYGEYIFDWSLAQAAARARIHYYPKLVVAVPFTPATGPRLLVHPDQDAKEIEAALLTALQRFREETDASSVHVLFCTEEVAARNARGPILHRTTHQYHFENPGYETFDDFLSDLRSEHRKQIKKERRKIESQGLSTELRPGTDLTGGEWSTLFELYTSTSGRKWGRPYLTRAFFEEAGPRVGHRALVGFARSSSGKIVAGTLSFAKSSTLYGRYWGCFEDFDGLHFELCYYQLIEHAIRHRMTRVEAGAQGEHKIKRGFRPRAVHSLHAFAHRGLSQAAARAFTAEQADLPETLEGLATHLPFRRKNA